MNYPPESMPWWQSRVIVGALVSIVMKVLVLSGVTADFTAAESRDIVDLVLILIGAIGDLVAIFARVRQRYAPAITAKAPKASTVLPMLLLFAVMVPLSSCASLGVERLPSSPSELSDRTKLDEQAALTATLAYTAAARAAALAIETGLVSDPETIALIGDVNRKAYAGVRAVAVAYQAGNADDYVAAVQSARADISALLDAINEGESE